MLAYCLVSGISVDLKILQLFSMCWLHLIHCINTALFSEGKETGDNSGEEDDDSDGIISRMVGAITFTMGKQ